MESTIRFYEDVLGFRRLADNLMRITEGGTVRMVYLDVGDGQYIVFQESKGVQGIPTEYDAGINGALGLPKGMYHYAFRVSSLDGLEARRSEIANLGIEVSPIVDLGHAKSIFLFDPNEIQIEICCQTREFVESDLHQESEGSVAPQD
jgi:catechol 2,3-dioxygenase-like lactoylglutathione lyase family enzyme